jgi:twitching motility protein PilT
MQDLRSIIDPIRNALPRNLTGVEFFEAMFEKIRQLPDEHISRLREMLDAWLLRMDEVDASDIDLGSNGTGNRIWYRIYGIKSPWLEGPEIHEKDMNVILLSVLMQAQFKVLVERKNLDLSYLIEMPDGEYKRYRANMYFDLNNIALNMRRINSTIRPFKSLNFHPVIASALSLKNLKYGMTLVTGITGSGKSATLDSIIDANNRSVESHIVIIASPIEMVHKPIKSIVRHREVGRDTQSFKSGAIESLRQDPDIIVIGELRDPETITTALEITDSGHKTFSTLHTASAVESIDRIIGEVSTHEQERVRYRLADTLTCVISQKLVPTVDGKRVMAKEVLLTTSSVKAAIRNNNTGEIYQMIMEGSAFGMHTLEQDLKRLYKEGVISMEEAYNYANNKKRFKDLVS